MISTSVCKLCEKRISTASSTPTHQQVVTVMSAVLRKEVEGRKVTVMSVVLKQKESRVREWVIGL